MVPSVAYRDHSKNPAFRKVALLRKEIRPKEDVKRITGIIPFFVQVRYTYLDNAGFTPAGRREIS
jgi:hypothetical protein